MEFHQSGGHQECGGDIVPPRSSQRRRQQIYGLRRSLGVLLLPGYWLGQILRPLFLLLFLLKSFLESFLQLDGRTAQNWTVSDWTETFLSWERGGGQWEDPITRQSARNIKVEWEFQVQVSRVVNFAVLGGSDLAQGPSDSPHGRTFLKTLPH